MYWKTDTIESPEWDRHSLLEHMAPFSLDQPRELSTEMAAYCRFYGLDLWEDHPELVYHQGYVEVDEHRVMMHYFRLSDAAGSKGTVFILHGYFDHVGLYTQLIDRCLGAGFDVLAYDQPGHGLSSGTPAAIGSFLEYQAVLTAVMAQARDKVSGPWFAVGQSTGGAILIDYLLSNHHNQETSEFRNVVLLAPLIRPAGWLRVRGLHTLIRPFLKQWRRVFAENSGNIRFLSFLREHDPLQARAIRVDWVTALRKWVPHIEASRPVNFSVTVVQGEKDLTVDWPHNLRIIRNKFSQVKERRLPEGRHHLVNEISGLQSVVFNTIIEAFSTGDLR